MNHVYALAAGFAGAFLALGFAVEGAALAFLAAILISLPVQGFLPYI